MMGGGQSDNVLLELLENDVELTGGQCATGSK